MSNANESAIQQGCFDKMGYISRGKAEAVARFKNRNWNTVSEAYQCANCGKWHLRRKQDDSTLSGSRQG